MAGLESIIRLRGGIENVERNPGLSRMIFGYVESSDSCSGLRIHLLLTAHAD
jgi:hypothetical protein